MKSKRVSRLRTITDILWISAALVLVVLALYVSLGRQLLPLINHWQDDLENLISEQLDTPVSIDQLVGGWQGLGPRITLKDLSIKQQGSPFKSALDIKELSFSIDISASLYYRNLVFSDLTFYGVDINLDQNEDGLWWLTGVPKSTDETNPETFDNVIETFLLQKHIAITDGQANLAFKSGAVHQLTKFSVVLNRLGQQRHLQGEVTYSEVVDTPFKIIIESFGDPRNIDEFSANGYTTVAAADWSPWIPKTEEVSVTKAILGASAWFDFQQGRMTDLRAQFNLPSLEITRTEKSDIKISDFNTELYWYQEGSQHRFWFNEIDLSLNNIEFKDKRIGFFYTPKEEQHSIRVLTDTVDLSVISNIIDKLDLLTEKQFEPIKFLKPKGFLNDIDIDIELSKENFNHPPVIDFKANVVALSVDQWGGVPKISGVNGFLQQRNGSGVIEVSAEDVELFFPNLYNEAWLFRAFEGWVQWDIKEDQTIVRSGPLNIAHDFANAQTEFSLNLNKDPKDEDLLALSLGINELNTEHKNLFIPKVLSKDVQGWIDQSIIKADLTQGQVLYQGAINEGAPVDNALVQVWLDVDKTEIKYLEDWPSAKNLNAKVMIDNGKVDVDISYANILGTNINKAKLKVAKNNQEKLNLTLKGTAQTSMGNGLRWFKETPIQEAVSNNLDHWTGTGDVDVDLDLRVPLEKNDKTPIAISLDANIKNSSIKLNDIDLAINDINGELSYSLKEGLNAQSIDASVFNQPIVSSIETHNNNHTIISVDGKVDIDNVRHWLKQPLLSVATGLTTYHSELHIKPVVDGEGSYLNVKTNLDGVTVNLPAPYAKKPEEKKSLDITLSLAKKRILNLVYSDSLNGVLALGDKGVERGQLYLGNVEAYLPSEPGLAISGHINQINWDEWVTVLETIADNSPKSSMGEKSEALNNIRAIRIDIDNLTMFSQSIGEINIDASRKDSGWDMKLKGPNILGKVWVPDDLSRTFNINLKKIHLPESDYVASADKNKDIDALMKVDPSIIPAMKANISEVKVGSEDFGRWRFETTPQLKGLQVSNIDGYFRKMNIAGDLGWRFDKEQHYTWFKSSKITAKNMDDVLKAWDLPTSIKSKNASYTADISWQGSPLAFNFKTLNGKGAMKIEDGIFVADTQTGALKLFGMLNFNAIARRLKLDFSDLYESGLTYDSVKGSFNVHNGLIEIEKAITIDGPGGKFVALGSINLVTKELDQELSVTLPVTGTLPLVAVLAGLNPVVAGAIWVTEKIIGDELERFTSVTYDVAGTWDDPKMKLKKTFDNKLEKSK